MKKLHAFLLTLALTLASLVLPASATNAATPLDPQTPEATDGNVMIEVNGQ